MRHYSIINIVFSLCLLFCISSCADKIPEKNGFKSLGLYSYDKKSASLSLSEDSSSSYLYYYLKDDALASGVLSSQEKIPDSLEVRFSPQDKDADIIIAFLYSSDFSDGKLNDTLPERPLAECRLPAGKTTSVRLAFPTDRKAVKGFLVYSQGTVSIDDVAKVNAVIGWYQDESRASWSFGPEGGDMASLLTASEAGALSMDLSSSLRFCSILDSSVQEYVRISFRDNPEDLGVNGQQGFVQLLAGEKSYRIRRSPGPQSEVFFAPYLFGADSGRKLSIESGAAMISGIEYECHYTDNGFSEKGFRLPAAIMSDLGSIPSWPSALWQRKDFELFRWNMFPEILLFDFADYKVQDDYLKRLAFYVEKAGYRGRLWSDDDLYGLHGYNAHDYRAESLASFYSTASAENFQLNESEYYLRDILLSYGIIRRSDDGKSFLPGKGGIISISKESTIALRTSLLAHESFHGIYFVDEPFRQKVSEVCSIMDQKSLTFLKNYFASQSTLMYDLNDTYLMENETMAYIMQQSVNAQSSYFADNIAKRGSVINYMPDLASYMRSTKASGFTAAATILDDYVFSRWGLNAGRTYMVSVSQN
ncbi:MAG: hypothetical protein K5930_07220 [Treponemataceae bacterium]|nr:hypothetical protein [Treponemataceae bacterium]